MTSRSPSKPTEPKALDPMIMAAIDRLLVIGETWREEDMRNWCDVFVNVVAMCYPPKPPRARRKSRAKTLAALQGEVARG